MKMRILGIILALAGLNIIAYGLYIKYDTLTTQRKILDQFEKMVDHAHEASNRVFFFILEFA